MGMTLMLLNVTTRKMTSQNHKIVQCQEKETRMPQIFKLILWYYAGVILIHTVALQSAFIGFHPSILARLWHMWAKLPNLYLVSYANGAPFSVNYHKTPIGRYGHMLMALPWCFIVIFQLNSKIRKKYPHLHRIIGYLDAFLEMIMMVGLMDIIISKTGFSYVERYAFMLHLQSALTIFLFLGTLILGINYAQKKQFYLHERTMFHHIAIGHGVNTQRVLISLTANLGKMGLLPIFKGESAQLLFSFLVTVGILVNCAAVEIWYKINRPADRLNVKK